jgi:putative DNA primase/helicase
MSLPCTDAGNALRLVGRFGKDFKYVPKWGHWIAWDNSRWVEDTGGMAMSRATRQTAGLIRGEAIAALGGKAPDQALSTRLMKWWAQSESRGRLEAMSSIARGELTVDHEKLDGDPWALNCSNGTVNLKTGRMRPHSRDDLFTKLAGAPFNPKAPAVKWEKFLNQVLPDRASREFLQRFIGYCATGSVRERTFVMLFGAGRNGKSVFLELVVKALGAYAGTAAPELLMAKRHPGHPTDVADLYGLRLAISTEVKKGRSFDEEQVKRLTGADSLKARRMREDFWGFSPTHKLILAANHRPRVADSTDSFWDRVALIPFDVRITDAMLNKNLVEELTRELPGILAWIVRGSLMWQKSGLKRPKAVEKATETYRASEDTVGRFLLECCDFEPSAFTMTSAIMERAAEWCAERNIRAFIDRELAERLEATEGVEKKHTMRGNGWAGISLT